MCAWYAWIGLYNTVHVHAHVCVHVVQTHMNTVQLVIKAQGFGVAKVGMEALSGL